MTSEIKNLYISKKSQELCGVPLTLQTSKQTEPAFLAEKKYTRETSLLLPCAHLYGGRVTKYCRATEALGLLGPVTDLSTDHYLILKELERQK